MSYFQVQRKQLPHFSGGIKCALSRLLKNGHSTTNKFKRELPDSYLHPLGEDPLSILQQVSTLLLLLQILSLLQSWFLL